MEICKFFSPTIFLQKFRQINFFTKETCCKSIWRKLFALRENFRNYHTVPHCLLAYAKNVERHKCNYLLDFRSKNGENNDEDQKCQSKCSREEETVIKTQNIKICTPVMEKICPDLPCSTCPLFCQSHSQIWCEDDFKVFTVMMLDVFEIRK